MSYAFEIRELELGYTPANLITLMDVAGLTYARVAQHLGVTTDAVTRWRYPVDAPSHRDMPLRQWLRFLELCRQRSAA